MGWFKLVLWAAIIFSLYLLFTSDPMMGIIIGGVIFLIYILFKGRTKGGISRALFGKGEMEEYKKINEDFIKLMIFNSFNQNLNRQVPINLVIKKGKEINDKEISEIEKEENKILGLFGQI